MKSTPNRALLEEIAAQVADRRPVDWQLLTRTHPDIAALLRQLAAVDAIASRHDEPASWGSLDLLDKLGEGTFGEVFRAHDRVLQRDVALKLARHAGDSHLAEARRLARVRHPNVVAIHGVEVHDGRAGMWMDLLPGTTLERVLEEHGPLSSAEIIEIGITLCDALGAVHGAGVFHGDIKAANIMREPSGAIVLMDFGAGRHGTPLILAPEVLDGGSHSVASDLYSVGVLLYRLATARYPFHADSLSELADLVRTGARIPVDELRPDLPPGLGRAIHRVLSVAPADRFETAAQLAGSLRLAGGESSRLPRRPPAHASLRALPIPETRFFGRGADLVRVGEWLERERFVTLVGPGGCGKTRLALEVASRLHGHHPDGVRWIDLSGVTDATYFIAEIARLLDIRADALERTLRDQSTLILVDNAEHLRDSCRGWIESILASASKVRFLVTSREPLGGTNEVRFEVLPLAVPDDDRGNDPATFDAIRLFLDRAASVRREFVLTPSNTPFVASICRRVDGIPLAIELAAARVGSMSIEEIDRRLGTGLGLLSSRSAPSVRHQTLEATLAWSWELLETAERSLLMRLAVFRGGCTAPAAEHVCSDVADPEALPPAPGPARPDPPRSLASPRWTTIDGAEVVDLLGDLVRRSLVVFDAERARYRLYEVVREFAAQRLRDADAEDALVARHSRYFVLFAVEADRALLGADQVPWLRRQVEEHENVHAALAACGRDATNPHHGLLLGRALTAYWGRSGLHHMGRSLLESQLARPENRSASAFRATALTSAGILAFEASDNLAARRFHEESMAIQEQLGNELGVAVSLSGLGDIARRLGEDDAALVHYERSVSILRKHEDRVRLGIALNKLALFHLYRGNAERARELHEEHLAIQRSCQNLDGIGLALAGLAQTLAIMKDYEQALSLAEECLTIRRRIAHKPFMITTLNLIADIYGASGRPFAAVAYLHEALSIQRDVERPQGLLHCLSTLGKLAEETGHLPRALTIRVAEFALRESFGETLSDIMKTYRDETIVRISEKLSPREAERAALTGRTMTAAGAVQFAFETLDALQST